MTQRIRSSLDAFGLAAYAAAQVNWMFPDPDGVEGRRPDPGRDRRP
jgi:hypothetical protein